MPGRQAHGRPLLAQHAARKMRKSKTKSSANALDAYAIAARDAPGAKRTPRMRELEPEPKQKHRRQEEDGDDDAGGGGEVGTAVPRKRRRVQDDAGSDASEGDFGSDSEGNEWQVGAGSDDSDIDSDDAFGESDEERFQDFTFRGSGSKHTKKRAGSDDGSMDDSDDDSLGSDAIDLAQALDEASDDESAGGNGGSASEEDSSASTSASDLEEADDDDEDDPSKYDALRSLVSGFGDAGDSDAEENTATKKPKIGLKDLGLFGVKDAHMKKSLKLMNKEEKASKPGSKKKLDIPLARRQQDRLLRGAAYEQTNKTLDRWTETVKHNRRAEHLVFPLPQNLPTAGLDKSELLPLNHKAPGNELEQAITSIMEASGIGPSTKKEAEAKNGPEDGLGQAMTRAEQQELVNQRRRERELHSREAARAKRIKKIKSKAYHRVHKKQRLRDEAVMTDEMPSDEEHEAMDRRRAMERMGARHKESKWAKMGSKTGRAAWDEEYRSGLTEMARKNEELRRRVEGRTQGSDDDASDTSSESEDESSDRLRQRLEQAAAEQGEAPASGIMALAFMKRKEAALKKSNDELVEQIRRDLGSDEDRSEDGEMVEVGRRQYGVSTPKPTDRTQDEARRRRGDEELQQATSISMGQQGKQSRLRNINAIQKSAVPADEPAPSSGAWTKATSQKIGSRRKKDASSKADIDLSNAMPMVAERAALKKVNNATAPDDDSEDEDALHLPVPIRDQELIGRAFAGDDAVGDFEREKAEVGEDGEEKVIDNTLPGWGSWVGEDVSNRQRKKHTGRFLTKTEGIKRKDRKDAKLERVIINEKRVRKNEKYLASQLPHPFESKLQYERSLRMPVGPEWSTKETFQDATKPRVIVKQGIITPIAKPIV